MTLDLRLMTICAAVLTGGLSLPQYASAQMVASGKTLAVTTANAVATFDGADLVGFVNVLTGETYLRNPSDGLLAGMYTHVPTCCSLQPSAWAIAPDPGTGVLVATITAEGTSRSLTMRVNVDPSSQEIVVRFRAAVSTSVGMVNAFWGIAGLDLTAGRLIVPARAGMVFDRSNAARAHFQYPNDWNAQMVVYQSTAGSFILYSTDTQGLFKDLNLDSRGGSTLDAYVATEAIAPFATASGVPEVEWRLKAVAGDWRTAAQPYRDWLAANRPPLSNAAHPWVANIGGIVGLNTLDASLLPHLATLVTPAQTLLYLIDWRQTPFDVNYLDYTPRAGVANFVATAHALGFKVMLHVNLAGVSPYNADYEAVRAYQVKRPDTLEPVGWLWDRPASTPQRMAFISPAAATFRALWISRIAAGIASVGPDALHLDVSGSMFNDGNGPIEGRNFAQGSALFHQEIVNAFPTLALGGEGEADVTYRYHSFAQSWNGPGGAPGHPIANFLFGHHVRYYGHLGQSLVPTPTFKNDLVELEQRAILPHIMVNSMGELDQTNPENARFFAVMRSWQTHAFQPAWTGDWTGALVKYQGIGGATAAFADSGTVMSLTAAGATRFELVHDSNQVTSTSFIRSWPAFDATRLYGLDPGRKYFLDPVPRPVTTHVTSLPDSVQLAPGTLVGPGFAHIELTSVESPFDFNAGFVNASAGVRTSAGVDGGLADRAVARRGQITAGGIMREGIWIEPPVVDRSGAETFVEYGVPVPAAATLQFGVALADFSTCSDGVTFRVTANGFELWREHINRGAWHDVVLDLGPWSGRTIALRLTSHPGPANNPFCDQALWSGLSLRGSGSAPPVSVPIALAAGSTVSGFDGSGVLSSTSPLSATVSNVPLPGAFTIFTQPGTPVSPGTNLATVSYLTRGAAHGELPLTGASVGAGNVGGATAGGVFKNPVIFASPPDKGRTTLAWAIRLPDAPLQLGFSVALADGALTDDGVDFQVRVNGVRYWNLVTLATQWRAGSLDLSRWKGQNILLELVTDALSNYLWDWALWGDLVLTPSGSVCSYAVTPPAPAGAFGGAVSANVVAPPGCPWSTAGNIPWLTIAAGSGSGSGAATIVAAPNAGPARSGTLTIAGHNVTITQAESSIVTNSPPTVSNIANIGARRNAPVTVSVTVGGGAGVVVSAASSNTAVVPNASIAVAGAGASRTLTITPALTGTTTILVTASARGFNATTTFRLTVHGTGPAADFDADSRSEIGIYRPSTGSWYLLQSSNAFTSGAGYAWGAAGDQPQIGDFDGDGKSEITVYRPSTAYWFILRSTTNYSTWDTYQWGTAGDVPVPADYDGDGRTDVAVYRPASGAWYMLLSGTGFTGGAGYVWGAGGDVPLPGDYDGDGRADLAVYRPSSGHWFILQSTTSYTTWRTYQWGSTGDVQVPADYDGDSRTDLAVYRPSNGTWYLLLSSSGFSAGAGYAWGAAGDVPVPEDYDGDGQTDVAVYRPATAHWFVLTSRSGYGASLTYQWGSSGDVPLPRRP